MDRREMGRKVQMLDFMMADTGLFLDTHPENRQAQKFYGKYKALYDKAKKEYEENFGPLTQMSTDVSKGWSWVSGPWPWEKED